ncbi:MAG: hypothetical protein AAF703_09440 [Cyanobacteria bacterium P01_D01_bin.105]
MALLFYLDFLQGPFWADEGNFWGISLTFSDRLFPTLDSLRDYNELNTPLPCDDKAHPWDKYILPVVIIFWYLKSIDFEEKPITELFTNMVRIMRIRSSH